MKSKNKSKTTEKPAAKKAVAKKKSKGLINSAMKLYILGADPAKTVPLSDYSVKVGSKYKVDPSVVKAIFGSIKAGATELNREDLGEVPKDQVSKLGKVFDKVSEDYATHVANKTEAEESAQKAKDAAKAEKEAAKKAKEERIQKSIVLMDKSVTAVAKTLSGIRDSVDKTISGFLGDKFTADKKTGLIKVKKGETVSQDDFLKGFAGFANLAAMQDEFAEAAAEREAQLALQAKTAFPDTWEEWFSARPRDLSRIKKGVALYETLTKIEVAPFGTMANMRKALELKVEKGNEAKNLEAKKEVANNVIAFQKKEDRPATQAEITEIKKKVIAKHKGEEHHSKPKQIYVIQDPTDGAIYIVSGPANDPKLLAVSAFSINDRMEKVTLDEEGDPKVTAIKPPTSKHEAIIARLLENLEGEEDEEEEEEKPKAKKGKKEKEEKPKKKKAPVKEEEEEEEEEEDEEDEDEDDDDSDDSDDSDDEEEEDEDSDDEDEDEDSDDEEEEEEDEDEDEEDEDSDDEDEDEDEEEEDEDEDEEDEE